MDGGGGGGLKINWDRGEGTVGPSQKECLDTIVGGFVVANTLRIGGHCRQSDGGSTVLE